MKPEHVELYRAIQKYRNQWRDDDACWHPEMGGIGNVTHIYYTTDCPRCQESIRVVRNGLAFLFDVDHPDLLWIPPPTPRWPGDNEKRTLWGMVDWEHHDMEINKRSEVAIYRYYDDGREGKYISVDIPLPEALLRAIEQKGE